MAQDVNRRWLLAEYPQGMPSTQTWRMEEAPRPEPGPGQILIRVRYLSVDPYMRGRISPARGYTKGVEIGELMQGGGVGEVVTSNHPDWKPGDIAESMGVGWQEYAVLTPDSDGRGGVNRIDPALAPIQSSLSWLGMPGMTAYFGLYDVGRPRPGDTLVVSAASGAVGQLVGQLAKQAGCRVVGIAGRDDKLAWCSEIGFDAVINHRSEQDLTGAVAKACPQGVDIFFEQAPPATIPMPVDEDLANLRRCPVPSAVASRGRTEPVSLYGRALHGAFSESSPAPRQSRLLFVLRLVSPPRRGP